MKLNEPEEKG